MSDDPTPPAGGTPPPPPPPPPSPPTGGSGENAVTGTPPPRPGETVPEGGLDPSQVFASPPKPPPQSTSQAQTGQATAQGDNAGVTTPHTQDTGPPPPPPGTKATKEMGYDDEDIRVLGEMGDYRFGSITITLTNDNITIPAHSETDFDEQNFLTLLRGSVSLTRDEKWRIIQAIPKLSQFQIDELQKILEEEKKKFSALSPKHLLQLKKLEQKQAEDWKDLQSVTVQEGAKKEEEQQAEEIRKQLGL